MPYFLVLLQVLLGLTSPPQPRFEAQTIDNNVSIGYGLAIGDVDGDKKPDILMADKTQFVWYRNPDWKRFVMIDSLTASDNVCIAARDIDGDGKVEVAVGAQWNPGETNDLQKSGSVHFLIRPKDPTQKWKAVELHHEVTIHRMKWMQAENGKFFLVVVPLHGLGNVSGSGTGVKIWAYEYPKDPTGQWRLFLLDSTMHMTHNFELAESKDKGRKGFYVAGKEGIHFVSANLNAEVEPRSQPIPGLEHAAGEIRMGTLAPGRHFFVTVEPMHGTAIVVYLKDENYKRIVLDEDVKEGHALAVADFLGLGSDQIVAGWRVTNKENQTGIKIFMKKDAAGNEWSSQWVDENGMACEDIQVADLDGDKKPDVIASGRATKNLKIYWNKTGQ